MSVREATLEWCPGAKALLYGAAGPGDAEPLLPSQLWVVQASYGGVKRGGGLTLEPLTPGSGIYMVVEVRPGSLWPAVTLSAPLPGPALRALRLAAAREACRLAAQRCKTMRNLSDRIESSRRKVPGIPG